MAPDLTVLALSTQLLQILENCGIGVINMVGQDYDGAATMSGDKNGVEKHILEKCPSAAYVHCASHILNLCVLNASEVPPIRATVTII